MHRATLMLPMLGLLACRPPGGSTQAPNTVGPTSPAPFEVTENVTIIDASRVRRDFVHSGCWKDYLDQHPEIVAAATEARWRQTPFAAARGDVGSVLRVAPDCGRDGWVVAVKFGYAELAARGGTAGACMLEGEPSSVAFIDAEGLAVEGATASGSGSTESPKPSIDARTALRGVWAGTWSGAVNGRALPRPVAIGFSYEPEGKPLAQLSPSDAEAEASDLAGVTVPNFSIPDPAMRAEGSGSQLGFLAAIAAAGETVALCFEVQSAETISGVFVVEAKVKLARGKSVSCDGSYDATVELIRSP